MTDDEVEYGDPRCVGMFGDDDDLVAVCQDPDRVQRLVELGREITPNAIMAACFTGSGRSLEILLSAKPDPDARLPGAESNFEHIDANWASLDCSPNFAADYGEWYPIQQALTGHYYGGGCGREGSSSVANVLLHYKADLFAVYEQPILEPYPFPFPAREGIDEDPLPSSSSDVSEDDFRGYGLRSILHSLIEDGAYIRPILEHPDLQLDLEHRDPQGQTLLHSACRSALGADATIEAVIEDLNTDDHTSNPPNPPNLTIIAPDASETSLFHTFRKRGADLTARDYNGKHILHHLLEARCRGDYKSWPPLIRNTLKYVLTHQPELINSPDLHGTYPIHLALQRLRGGISEWAGWEVAGSLEDIVYDLLEAGADATTKDSRGNTALHYLADRGLTDLARGAKARAICQRICDAGLEVNARNDQQCTALMVLMNDNHKVQGYKWRQEFRLRKERSFPSDEETDEEIFTMLDKAGARWTERDSMGRTLLHILARHKTVRMQFRLAFLLGKGVDPHLKDHKGRTAIDVAEESENDYFLEYLPEEHSLGAELGKVAINGDT